MMPSRQLSSIHSHALLGATAALLALSLAAPTAQAAEAWLAANSMATPRDYHAATRLGDGRVLVMGSSNPRFNGALPGGYAEIFDPATDTWSLLISADSVNFDMTLTQLDSGRVLVTGGRISTLVARASAQLLDVATGALTNAGSMAVPRANHAAVKLLDGRVLAAGGEGHSGGAGVGSAYTASLYNPATNSWSAAPPMNAARSRPTAERLASGRVLVVGGNSAEVYDPFMNSWTATGPMRTGTGGLNHAMTVLADGRVMSIGGSIGVDGRRDCEIYDPATNQWTTAAPMIEGRSFHTATLLADGRVVAAGGHQLGPIWHSEIYDPATNTWSQGPNLNRRRDLHTATPLLDGRVLVTGSALATDYDRASAELFTPGVSPPPPAPWNLTVTTFKQGGTNRATLQWSAQPNTERYGTWYNGTFAGYVTTTTFTHDTGLKGRQTGTYMICANLPDPCQSVTATW